MNENERSTSILEQKIDQILSVVTEVKVKVEKHNEEITDIKVKLALQEQTDNNLKDNIEKINKKSDDNKKWLLGLLGTFITGIAMIIINIVISI